METLLGQHLENDRYHVVSQLGEGGMGTVYLGRDSRLDTDIVIKVPHRAMLADREFRERFQREIQSLVKLTHPHVVNVIDVGELDGLPFVVMQFLGGGSLAERRNKPNTFESISGWLPEIAKALDFIHGKGYIHRDVKPANILFDENENAFLGDFGIAKVAAETKEKQRQMSLTSTGVAMGTPEYMAPELCDGRPVDNRVDQYALAVTVYELLSGRCPVIGATPLATIFMHKTHEPQKLMEVLPGIPDRVSEAVEKAMSKEPDDRFSCCQEFAEYALLKTGSGVTVSPPLPDTLPNRSAPELPASGASNTVSGSPNSTLASPPPPPLTAADSATVENKTQESNAEKGVRRDHCPKCKKLLRVPPDMQNRIVVCPNCNSKLTISEFGLKLKPLRAAKASAPEKKPLNSSSTAENSSKEPQQPAKGTASESSNSSSRAITIGSIAAGLVIIAGLVSWGLMGGNGEKPESTKPNRDSEKQTARSTSEKDEPKKDNSKGTDPEKPKRDPPKNDSKPSSKNKISERDAARTRLERTQVIRDIAEWQKAFVVEDTTRNFVSRQSSTRRSIWKRQADLGNSNALVLVADCYEMGVGYTKDEKKAFELYKKSADQSNSIGQWSMGLCYSQGKGVTASKSESIKWYKLSAANGNHVAMNQIGSYYDTGYDAIKKDRKTAYEWYRKAADAGNADAQVTLGNAYRYGISTLTGYKKNEPEAAKWFKKAADQGVAVAQYRLGFLYRYGDGITKSNTKALELYEKAGENGYDFAAYQLGTEYLKGSALVGGKKSSTKALKWMKVAADRGYLLAISTIGNAYRDGSELVGKKDLAEAFRWLKKAANLGNTSAQSMVGLMYRRGEGVKKDEKLAVYWYRKAADGGNYIGMFNLGVCYESGYGVTRNKTTALQWYEKSYANGKGYKEAKKSIDSLKARK